MVRLRSQLRRLLAALLLSTGMPTAAHAQDYVLTLVLSGQSNMFGRALASPQAPENNGVQFQYSASAPTLLNVIKETANAAADKPDDPNGSPIFCTGPELVIANHLRSKYPNSKMAIVKYAVGATHLEWGWDPIPDGGNADYYDVITYGGVNEGQFYGELVSEVATAVTDQTRFRQNDSLTPILAGFVWMQGEWDAMKPQPQTIVNGKLSYDNELYTIPSSHNAYAGNLYTLITTIKNSFPNSVGATATPGFPFYFTTLAPNINWAGTPTPPSNKTAVRTEIAAGP